MYPFIELFTACVFTLLFLYIEPSYWLGYATFFSALIVTMRTDIETLLISRYVTVVLIPLALVFSLAGLLPLTLYESILGTVFGYIVLWAVAHLFLLARNKEGIGEGDFELLAMIGAFTGATGVWMTLFIGAFIGSCFGVPLILAGAPAESTKIPFGSCLALAGIIYVFLQQVLIAYLV